jgi:hypothetical protein
MKNEFDRIPNFDGMWISASLICFAGGLLVLLLI